LAAFSIFPPNLGFGSGLPRTPIPFLLSRRPIAWVAPRPRSFGCAGDDPFEFPRTSHAFSAAGFSEVPGFPGVSHFLLQRLRYRSQVAPRSVPPALPVIDRRVASILASFGGAGCESSRLPLRFAPPVSPTISIRVAPNAHPPVPADHCPSYLGASAIRFALVGSPDCSGHPPLASSIDQSPSRPESSIVRRRRFRLSRVAPKLSSSADPHLLPQVAPASAFTAGSMMSPWLNRTLHPRLAPRMNLRHPIRYQHS